MTIDDRQRLDALIQGAFAANERGNVAIKVSDLRWLTCQVDNLACELQAAQQKLQLAVQPVAPPAAVMVTPPAAETVVEPFEADEADDFEDLE